MLFDVYPYPRIGVAFGLWVRERRDRIIVEQEGPKT
uniref:Uncharacterized protein n=1 Tax=Arundo donax TaxID=35708 RepID=A0A0A9BMF7_ARUDO